MAGGMDWFRWHHGSITDPKFQLVAKRACARFGDVMAIWAFILEMASANNDRGTFGHLDLETIDHLLGAEEGTASRVIDAMTQRGLIDAGRVGSWDQRQTKRERADDKSTERVKAFRAKQRQKENETPCNAMERQETPREEKRREENKEQDQKQKQRAPRFDAQAHLVSIGIDASIAADWITHRKAKKAAITMTVIDGISREAIKARMPLADVLVACCQRGWIGFKAEWMQNVQNDQQSAPFSTRRDIERDEVSAVLCGRQPASQPRLITGEVVS